MTIVAIYVSGTDEEISDFTFIVLFIRHFDLRTLHVELGAVTLTLQQVQCEEVVGLPWVWGSASVASWIPVSSLHCNISSGLQS